MLFNVDLNKLNIKDQSHPKSRKLDAFGQKNMQCHSWKYIYIYIYMRTCGKSPLNFILHSPTDWMIIESIYCNYTLILQWILCNTFVYYKTFIDVLTVKTNFSITLFTGDRKSTYIRIYYTD